MINISRGQIITVAFICLLGILFALPNLFEEKFTRTLPGWVPNKQMSLGLDLQGGAHLLFQADMTKNITEDLKDLRKGIRTEFRRQSIFASIARPRDGVKSFRIRIRKRGGGEVGAADIEKARDAIQRVLRERNAAGSALTGTAALYEVSLDEKGAGRVGITEAGELRLLDRLIEQAISVIRRRIDETGVREPTVQRQGRNRILVQVPGIEDPEEIKTLIGKTAKMTFHLVNHDLGDNGSVQTRAGTALPRGTILIEHNDYTDENSQVARFVAVRDNVELDGESLADATQCFDQNTGLPAVCFRFNTSGARTFCRITRENIGRRFAAVLDGKAVTAPTIQAAICDGSGIITGQFTIQGASRIALLLRAGALPVDLKVVEERTVGPGLGQDNIDAGKIASILGLVFVIIFMGVAYGRFGLMANVALVFNLVLIAGALSLLQATLTLPGIAGIVLTIGMAVDANVLIFERIREEVRSGRTPLSAIDTGYRRAMTTIIDSNLTTFIAALLLFLFGSGPVQGFGVTLAIGLATSMFTAIMVTRLLVVTWWRVRRPTALPI